jgi:hypothetical protein
MRYQVRFVSDTSLPEGVEYAFARQGDETYLFVKQGAVDTTSGRCDALSRAWERWQDADAESVPMRLVSV